MSMRSGRPGSRAVFKAVRVTLCSAAVVAGLAAMPVAYADDANGFGSRLQAFREMRANKRENDAPRVSEEDLGAHTQNVLRDRFDGRDMILYVPTVLPPPGQRAMVVALHGGGGNAQFIKDHLNMDGVAERNGFIVAYLNGSGAGTMLPGRMKAWNAGNGCCGEPYRTRVDDVGYITGAVHYLARKCGIDPNRVFGIGHSNGAMMTETLICETGLYRSAIALAGSLMAEADSCPAARGRTILRHPRHGRRERPARRRQGQQRGDPYRLQIRGKLQIDVRTVGWNVSHRVAAGHRPQPRTHRCHDTKNRRYQSGRKGGALLRARAGQIIPHPGTSPAPARHGGGVTLNRFPAQRTRRPGCARR